MKQNLPITTHEKIIADRSVFTVTTDLKGIITSACNDFITTSGYSLDELLGKNHRLMRHPDMPSSIFDNMWYTLKGGKTWNGLIKNRCKNGDYFWVDTFITHINEHGAVIGYQSIQTRPNSARVARTESLYAQMRNGQLLYTSALTG